MPAAAATPVMTPHTCIIIGGPTAVGKTALAITLARHFSTSILSADSRQCFRELNIGVAKPSNAELEQAHHYFINSHSIQDNVTAADYETYALHSLEEIFRTAPVAIVVGGTGLYLKALMEGLDSIPPVAEDIRQQIISEYESKGLRWLQQTVAAEDPLYYSTGETQNPQRLMRALEVVRATGQSIRHFQQASRPQRPFRMIPVRLSLPRETLYERINQRVDTMMAEGLLQEVKSLLPWKHLNALQTVGYQELFEYFEGKSSLEEAVEKIKVNTRHYAKRQETWFKKFLSETPYLPGEAEKIIEDIKM